MTKTPKPTRTNSKIPLPKPRKFKVTSKGFTCPTCAGPKPVRMVPVRTSRPMRGLIVRYRRCPKCGHKVKTEERLSKDGYEANHNPPK